MARCTSEFHPGIRSIFLLGCHSSSNYTDCLNASFELVIVGVRRGEMGLMPLVVTGSWRPSKQLRGRPGACGSLQCGLGRRSARQRRRVARAMVNEVVTSSDLASVCPSTPSIPSYTPYALCITSVFKKGGNLCASNVVSLRGATYILRKHTSPQQAKTACYVKRIGEMASEDVWPSVLTRLHTDKDVDRYLQESGIERKGETP